MTKKTIKIGIVGGTGYTGVELLRLLVQHPNASLTAITSRSANAALCTRLAGASSEWNVSGGPASLVRTGESGVPTPVSEAVVPLPHAPSEPNATRAMAETGHARDAVSRKRMCEAYRACIARVIA